MIFVSFLALLLSLVLMGGPPGLSQAQEFSEWEVTAQCLPQSEMSGPQGMRVRYLYQTAAAGATLDAFLSVDGGLEIPSVREGWDTPSKGFVSVLFPGPKIEKKIFCQESQGPKTLHLSYYKNQGSKIYLSAHETFSNQELDGVDGPRQSTLPVWPEGKYQNEYLAGAQTANPYWLQFSVPIHSPHFIQTALRYLLE